MIGYESHNDLHSLLSQYTQHVRTHAQIGTETPSECSQVQYIRRLKAWSTKSPHFSNVFKALSEVGLHCSGVLCL